MTWGKTGGGKLRIELSTSRLFAPLSLLVPLLAAVIAIQSCAKTAPAPLPVSTTDTHADAIALTFGRCNPGAKACPRPMEPEAVGDTELQSELLKCFGEQLGRPVYVLGNAPIPQAYWLDASVWPKSADAQAGRTTVAFYFRHGPDEYLAGFLYSLPANAASYREICRQFSERVRSRVQ